MPGHLTHTLELTGRDSLPNPQPQQGGPPCTVRLSISYPRRARIADRHRDAERRRTARMASQVRARRHFGRDKLSARGPRTPSLPRPRPQVPARELTPVGPVAGPAGIGPPGGSRGQQPRRLVTWLTKPVVAGLRNWYQARELVGVADLKRSGGAKLGGRVPTEPAGRRRRPSRGRRRWRSRHR